MSPRHSRAARRLNRRALVVIGATVTGLALPVAGFVDHVLLNSPTGKGFNVGSVTHWTCAVLFIAFVAVHVVLNRKAYRRHLAEVSGGLPFSSRACAGAAMTVAVSDTTIVPRSSRHHRHETPYVRLDRRACEACGACAEACPHGVIDMIDLPLHHHARLRHPERCRGCLACVAACEHSAMTATSRRPSSAVAEST